MVFSRRGFESQTTSMQWEMQTTLPVTTFPLPRNRLKHTLRLLSSLMAFESRPIEKVTGEEKDFKFKPYKYLSEYLISLTR